MRPRPRRDERIETRPQATEAALDQIPTQAPADAMLDFYNELGRAIKGRLTGAGTLARVNDALRDLFSGFFLQATGGPCGFARAPWGPEKG